MKILQINTVNGIRSTGRTTLELAEYLKNNGHQAYIAYCYGIKFENEFLIGSKTDRKIHAFMSRLTGLQGYFSKAATRNLIKYIDQIEPDIVHLRNLHSNFINLELLLGYLANKDIATVITLHDCWFYTGKCCYYTTDNCYRWQESCGSCPRLRKDNPSWLFDFTKKMLNDKKYLFSRLPRLATVTVSEWLKNEVEKSFLKSTCMIKNIYNWIDLDLFKPNRDFQNLKYSYSIRDKFVILTIATSWSARKGLSDLIRISKNTPENCCILIVGKIPADTQFGKNIILEKETHDIQHLVNLYNSADVFLNLSKEETFGKVTAEALACGTPVITNSRTANPELVDKSCGFIAETDDDVINAIKVIIKKSKGFYSINCRNRAELLFDKKKNIQEYINLYHKLLKSKKE